MKAQITYVRTTYVTACHWLELRHAEVGPAALCRALAPKPGWWPCLEWGEDWPSDIVLATVLCCNGCEIFFCYSSLVLSRKWSRLLGRSLEIETVCWDPMFCPFISSDFILGIGEHDFQRSAGIHSLSFGSMNLSSSSGALSPLWLSLISLYAYCSLVFLFVLLFPLIHPSNAAFSGASWDCILQTFQMWACVEQISSSCPSVQVSIEEGSVFFPTALVLILNWTYVSVVCEAPTKYTGSYSQKECRWEAKKNHWCNVFSSTFLEFQICSFILPLVWPHKNVVGVCCVFCTRQYGAAELLLLKKQGFHETFVHGDWAVRSHHSSKENLLMNKAFCVRCKLLASLGLSFERHLHAVWAEHA